MKSALFAMHLGDEAVEQLHNTKVGDGELIEDRGDRFRGISRHFQLFFIFYHI